MFKSSELHLSEVTSDKIHILAGSSKRAPRILIFSIAMGADYSFYVKSIATYASTFFEYNNSVLAIVFRKLDRCCCVGDFNPLGYGFKMTKNY